MRSDIWIPFHIIVPVSQIPLARLFLITTTGALEDMPVSENVPFNRYKGIL